MNTTFLIVVILPFLFSQCVWFFLCYLSFTIYFYLDFKLLYCLVNIWIFLFSPLVSVIFSFHLTHSLISLFHPFLSFLINLFKNYHTRKVGPCRHHEPRSSIRIQPNVSRALMGLTWPITFPICSDAKRAARSGPTWC